MSHTDAVRAIDPKPMLWVTTAYVLASTVAMPIYGKLGDLIGRRGLFLGALVLFAVGSVACALAAAMG